MSLKNFATDVASNLSAGSGAAFGLDPFTILTIVQTLLPFFIQCFKSSVDSAGQTPQQFLAANFDESTGTFDQHLIDRARGQTRRAARQEGQRHLTRDQLDAITIQSFMKAKDADDATVSACLAEVNPS